MNKFIHTHVHSEYSILDGMSRVEDLVKAAKSDGQKAIAVTDHGKMGAVPELIAACKEHDLKPIVGQEFYIVEDAKDKNKDIDNSHLVLLALNDRGYKVLCELSSEASLPENFYRNPRIDYEMLRSYGKELKNIVAYTTCLSGEIPDLIRKRKLKSASRKLRIYRNIFPNLFFEFMSHGTNLKDKSEIKFRSDEDKVNETLWRWHKRYDVPVVITNDSHYTKKDQEKHMIYCLLYRQEQS